MDLCVRCGFKLITAGEAAISVSAKLTPGTRRWIPANPSLAWPTALYSGCHANGHSAHSFVCTWRSHCDGNYNRIGRRDHIIPPNYRASAAIRRPSALSATTSYRVCVCVCDLNTKSILGLIPGKSLTVMDNSITLKTATNNMCCIM